jgi:hypothetical protein
MAMELFFETMEQLTPQLQLGDLAWCESAACDVLRRLPKSPFHIAADLSISNNPIEAALHFDHFYLTEMSRFKVEAVYTEMNGFDINPDRWYCDLFAYEADGGMHDYDWLAYWQSGVAEEYTITGLEKLQAVYDSKAIRNPAYSEASYLSTLVVVTKFQRFMQLVFEQMNSLKVPLYVTAHDFDYIARIPPLSER